MDTVTIPRAEYEELKSEARLLQCLRNNGVDNWDWWDSAIEEFQDGED